MNVSTGRIMEDLDDYEDEFESVSKQVYATTKGGKDIIVYHKLNFWLVKFATGGQLPSSLNGRFTTYKVASEAVDEYLSNSDKEEVTQPKKVRTKPKSLETIEE